MGDTIDIKNCDGIDYLHTLDNNSIDLILTDPPYIISKDAGMNKLYNSVKNKQSSKTEEEWVEYKKKLKKPQSELDADKGKGWSKENYLKYGTILGKKYATKTDYGNWDSEFTIEQLNEFVNLYYRKLKKSGTLIIWFDIWKITELKEIMEKAGFKQIRFIEWMKTNPIPINSSVNYLTNAREIALTGVKCGKPTFNEKYHKGVFEFPIESGSHKFHPTQKNVKLFEELIRIHSNPNDIVLDSFLGGGTTAHACKNTNRKCKGCEIYEPYYKQIKDMLAIQ